MNFNTGKYKKTLNQTLEIFDKFLNDMTASKISNADYRELHKIFDKYMKKEKRERASRKEGKHVSK